MIPHVRTASFAHKELALSLLLPEDWYAEELGSHHMRFHGPQASNPPIHHPTLSIQAGEPEGVGRAWFESFAEQARQRLCASLEGFCLRRHERYTLSSLVPVDATWYEFNPADGMRTAQVQALISAGARLYVVNGATRVEHAARHLPLFDAILRSIRVLQ